MARLPLNGPMSQENTVPAPVQRLIQTIEALPTDDNWGVAACDLILTAAHELACSDIHVLCQREDTRLQARRDGVIIPLLTVPKSQTDLLIGRLKVMSRLPAFIRHEPQDGRIEWMPPGAASSRPTVLRVSVLPTIHGENIVIRFPEPAAQPLELEALGMTPDVLKRVRNLVSVAEGTVLFTGPSSAGKTTTMYAILRHLHKVHGTRVHILSIEDPVEADLGFASQVSINEAQGLTFGMALRAALRQDPNIIMIGEMRDAETARIATQAALSGHLILSTIHAGRAFRVFSRMLAMGIEPYLVASALTGVVAQRLVRRLCPACRTKTPSGWQAPGCDDCAATGYAGRIGLFEVITVDETLRDLIIARTSPDALATHAKRHQVGDLLADAHRLAAQGEISRAELTYLAGDDEAASS